MRRAGESRPTRREFQRGLGGGLAAAAAWPLGPGIRSRMVSNVNGLTMHLLEAGYEDPSRPGVLLLHGFPELAYSWRKVLPALAAAGYHAFAPDQRGYGKTTGWSGEYGSDISPYRFLNLVRDALGLVRALGRGEVAAVVGHDFGSPVAAWCALIRPDVFRSVVLMSAPFAGPPAPAGGAAASGGNIHAALAALKRPRKHYQWYYSGREANDNMRHAPQGIHAFLRAYFHMKSADWKQNLPYPLARWSAEELEKLPTYYVMDLGKGMAETVAEEMPTAREIAACRWLTEDELRVYSSEFARTGFQGGLQWYRCGTSGCNAELDVFHGRTIDVPALFVAGRSDWGVYQRPGSLERMRDAACTRLAGIHLIEGAGHWVQQEQPERVNELLVDFLGQRRAR